MLRVLLIVLAVLIGLRILRNLRTFFSAQKPRAPKNPDIKNPQELIACDGCKIFVLKEKAINVQDKHYCSEECRKRST